MGLFSKKREVINPHPAVHQHLVAVSFSHVRKDVQNLYEWIHYLHAQSKVQQELIGHMSRQLQGHALRGSVMDEKSQAHIQELKAHLAEIDRRVSSLAARPTEPKSEVMPEVLSRMSQIVERLEQKARPQPALSSSLQEKVAKKVQQKSKEYIGNVIRNLIQKYSKMSGLQLREIVVDEQALCSRSSFYRILSEIEEEGLVNVDSNGKEKIYSALSDAVIATARNL